MGMGIRLRVCPRNIGSYLEAFERPRSGVGDSALQRATHEEGLAAWCDYGANVASAVAEEVAGVRCGP